jgi:hypothetical protein
VAPALLLACLLSRLAGNAIDARLDVIDLR